MGHEIAGNAETGVHAFAYVGDPAWHVLGEPIQEPMTVKEATKFAHMDYTIEKCAAVYDTPWGMLDGDNAVGLVRQPTDWDNQPRVLGRATEDYSLLQNMEVAELLEPLATKWPLETIGALGDGERSFWVLKFGEHEVGGISSELLRRYLFISDDKRAGTSFSMQPTDIRVVCNNTWKAALAGGGAIQLPHRGDLLKSAGFHLRLIESARQSMDEVAEKFDAMVQRRITEEEANKIFYAAFPMPKPSKSVEIQLSLVGTQRYALLSPEDQATINKASAEYELEKDRREKLVQGVRISFLKMNDEHPKIANSLYAAWNAVTEQSDHRVGRGSAATVSHSLLFGNRAAEKDRAFAAAIKLL